MSEISNILVFSTYPLISPRHGGQFRAQALLNAYREFGKTTYVAICNSAVYSEADCSPTDIRIPQRLQEQIEISPYREQILIGQFALEDDELQSRIKDQISTFSPKLIVFEQPYLWPAVKNAFASLNISLPKIIYSSHNIEAEHYETIGCNSTSFESDLKWITNTENQLVSESSLIIATTSEDLGKFSANKEPQLIALVNNGFKSREDQIKPRTLRQIAQKINFRQFALFVASAHTPNIDGFMEFVGTRLGFLPPETGIVIVGTAGPIIGNIALMEDPRWIDLFWSKVQIWGFASELELAAISEIATLFILPISDGGGSNLKTAQALQSKKPIVCTNHALRGFDGESNRSEVVVIRTESAFKENVSSILAGNYSFNITESKSVTSWDFSDLSKKFFSKNL